MPSWEGEMNSITLFSAFSSENETERFSPEWYKIYNTTKHDRKHEFKEAKFRHMIDAIAGLVVILSSQFYTNDFSYTNTRIVLENKPNDKSESAIGEYFRIIFPDFEKSEQYDISNEDIINNNFSFQKYPYSN